jgi:RecJ-like exonuclease
MTKPFEETEDHYIVNIERACGACGGTGIYVGMGEREGAAVVCSSCKGTGKVTLHQKHPKFKVRVRRKDVERVFQTGCGYIISAKDVKVEGKPTVRFSQAGASYEDWLNGATPKPIEDLHCPYMHTNQNMQMSDHEAHDLYLDRCSGGNLGSLIADCKLNHDKAKCWQLYYALVGKKDGS